VDHDVGEFRQGIELWIELANLAVKKGCRCCQKVSEVAMMRISY
jgi:uncharacterized protein YaeQ